MYCRSSPAGCATILARPPGLFEGRPSFGESIGRLMVQEVRNIRREVLPNGLTLITEEMEHIRSASIGIWIKTGSRDEDPKSNGISHFIEHMVFKGTKHRTAEEIA